MTSCQSTRKYRKDHKRQSTQDKKKEICKKKVLQHNRKCGRSERKLVAMRSDFGSCRTKWIRTKIADAEMGAELQGLQEGEERRGSNASQTGVGCLEEVCNRLSPWERMKLRPLYKGSKG